MTRKRTALTLWAIVMLGTAAFVGGDGAQHITFERRLRVFAPGMDPDLARHIACDSERAWLAYCKSAGDGRLAGGYGVINNELRNCTYPQFLVRRQALERASLRIALAFDRVYAFTGAESVARRALALSPEKDFKLRQLERRYVDLASDTTRSLGERSRLAHEVGDTLMAWADSGRALSAYVVAARCDLERGRRDLHRARLRVLLDLARKCRQLNLTSQLLGELGGIHRAEGREDSMRICFDEGIALARRHSSPGQEARFRLFYVTHYAGQGRLALALSILAEVQRLSDQSQDEVFRGGLQLNCATRYAMLGRWDLVGRSLRRLPPLLRAFPSADRELEKQRLAFDVDLLRARHAFATGQTVEGDRLMRRMPGSIPSDYRRVGFADLFDAWSAGLETSGQPALALEICVRGLEHCDSVNVPERAVRLLFRKARLLESLNQPAGSTVALDSAEALVNRFYAGSDDALRDIAIIRSRLLARRGHRGLASTRIRQILREFRARLRAGDGDLLGYRELDAAETIRDAVHQIEQFRPEQGFRFEMEWRSMSQDLGSAQGRRLAENRSGAPIASLTEQTPRLGTHLVYRFTADGLLRWTAARGSVVLDTLPISANECLRHVREALSLMQAEPPAPGRHLGPEALRVLRPLSGLLLPRSLPGERSDLAAVYVSPDGPLLALPFEALPTGPGNDEPLALVADIAYVHGWDHHKVRSDGPAVVVSSPSAANGSPAWSDTLTVSDAQAAVARWPGAQHFSHEQATKDAVLAHWPGASIIYLAAHHVRDPNAPYGFVQLAQPEGAPAHEAFLEIPDIHSLDLSACRLAILASCSSGAPYRLAIRPGPSLGDAFLDSGAKSVVQSFWDVEDAEARDFMEAFLATWREDGSDAEALGRARRQLMATPQGASPRVWAAWSVHTVVR
jgi:hypothetical protein